MNEQRLFLRKRRFDELVDIEAMNHQRAAVVRSARNRSWQQARQRAEGGLPRYWVWVDARCSPVRRNSDALDRKFEV
jgi:hypothetical protein